MKKFFFIISLLIFATGNSFGQIKEVTTGGALKEMKDGLIDLVDRSLDRADFTVAKAAVEMLGIIDAWEKANSNLLKQAFDGIEITSQNLFARVSALIEQANAKGSNLIKTAEEISITAAQIGESLPLSKKRTYILDYGPKVINPAVTDSILITLKGVNLEKSNSIITLPDSSSTAAKVIGPKEINFWLPITSVKTSGSKSKLHEVTVEHKTRDGNFLGLFPKYERVKRTIILTTLPNEFASYTLSGTRSFKKEDRRIFKVDCGKFEGTNTEINQMARPPAGFKWDLRRGPTSRNEFKVLTTGTGEKGRCQGIIWNGSGENGVIVNARVDVIQQVKVFPPKVIWKNGYIHCGLSGPIYRFIDSTAPMRKQSGKILWNKDHSINFENDVSSFELRIKLPNGEEKIITNNFQHELFSAVKEGSKLIIRPKIPKEISL